MVKSTLIKIIMYDHHPKGCLLDVHRAAALAYDDDITVIIRNQREMEVLKRHLPQHEQASGANLNQDKMEGVWIRK